MKRQFIFFLILAVLPFATQGQDIEREKSIAVFNRTADLFEKSVLPYLKAFAVAQYPPGNGKEYDQLIDATFKVFEQKMEFLRKDSYDFFFKKKDSNMNYKNEVVYKKEYCGFFHGLYSHNFPGLDYKFFEKVEKECGTPFN